jgi:hypothetical protein
MPYVFKEPKRPEPWRQYRWRTANPLLLPFVFLEWISEWGSWFLGRWAFLEMLEYCGSLSILIGVIFYFAGTKDRTEQKHYQAWQVINTAQGKGGSGGRIDALQELNADGVALDGVNLDDAYLQNVKLPNAQLLRASLGGADARGADLHGSDLEIGNLVYTNLRGADLRNVRFARTDFTNGDLQGADLSGADLHKVNFDMADLRNADLAGIANWQDIDSMKMTNIFGCQNAPDGFRQWALAHGAVEIESDTDWDEKIKDSPVTETRPSK